MERGDHPGGGGGDSGASAVPGAHRLTRWQAPGLAGCPGGVAAGRALRGAGDGLMLCGGCGPLSQAGGACRSATSWPEQPVGGSS